MRFLQAGSRRVEVAALVVASVLGLIVSWWVLSRATWAVVDAPLGAAIILGGAASAVLVLWFLPPFFVKGLQFWSLFWNLDTLFFRFVYAEMAAIVGSLVWAVALLNLFAPHKP